MGWIRGEMKLQGSKVIKEDVSWDRQCGMNWRGFKFIGTQKFQ